MYALNKETSSQNDVIGSIKTSSSTNSSNSHFLEKSCILGHISNHISYIKWIIPSNTYVHSIYNILIYLYTCSNKKYIVPRKKTPFQPKALWLSAFEPSKLFRDFRVTRSQWAPPSQGQQDLRRGSRWPTLTLSYRNLEVTSLAQFILSCPSPLGNSLLGWRGNIVATIQETTESMKMYRSTYKKKWMYDVGAKYHFHLHVGTEHVVHYIVMTSRYPRYPLLMWKNLLGGGTKNRSRSTNSL